MLSGTCINCGDDDAALCMDCVKPESADLARLIAEHLGGEPGDWVALADYIAKWLG